jgi:signal transduction histidine kinase
MLFRQPVQQDEWATWLCDALAAAGAYAWSWDAVTQRVEWAEGEGAPVGRVPRKLDEIDELVNEEDRVRRRSALARALSRGEPWVCTFRLARGPDERWMEERGRVWVDAEGRPARATALAVDVTASKRTAAVMEHELRRESLERHTAEATTGLAEAALHALRRSEALLQSIFASMEAGVVLYAADGSITRANPRARQMLGMDAGEASDPAHDPFERLLVVDVEGRPVPRDQLPVAVALRGEPTRGVPLALRFPDGGEVWATAGAAPIHAPDGTAVGAVLTLADVTRLRELQEQQEDMARMISHDLRTPLGVILAQAKLLGRRNEGASAVRARGEAIAASAQRMATMLNDLVESTLLEAGKLRLELEPLDVVAMLRDLRARLAAPFHGERIRVEAADDVPEVLADPNRIERVLVNLLTNALKYSKPSSEVVVRVRPDGSHLLLEVEDRGQGISPTDLPRLFERYFRALGSSRLEGMGLGLYTARMLVEAHGGTIGAASAPGRGSVFHVRLPLRSPA